MRRKALISSALVAAMAFGICSCGIQEASGSTEKASMTSQEASPVEFETLNDVFSSDVTDFTSIFNENAYVCAFCLDDIFYRVYADLPAGMFEELSVVVLDSEADAQDLLAPLAVTHQEVFAEGTPTEQELDAYRGRTGAELTAEGYTFKSLALNGNETICTAIKNTFAYLVTFEGAVADPSTSDYTGAVHDMIVTSVWFAGIAPHMVALN